MAPASPPARPYTLHGLLLRALLPVLVVLLPLSGALSYWSVQRFADEVYDRELAGAARAIGAQLIYDEAGQAQLHVSLQALDLFPQFGRDDTRFRVSQGGREVVGSGDLRLPPGAELAGTVSTAAGDLHYLDATVDGSSGRALRYTVRDPRSSGPVVIEIAQSTAWRDRVGQQLLFAALGPQVLVLVLVVFFVERSVRRGLAPLGALARELGGRSDHQLEPLPLAPVPLELAPVVVRFNQAMARLSDVLDSQRHFVADAAHQLRTPLAAIRLEAESALCAADAAGRAGALHRLYATTERTIRLANQLLSLARAEPNAPLESTRCDLAAIARATGEEWMPRVLARGIEFEFDGPERPVWLTGDAGLLRELVSNLIENAVQHGGGRLWLKVEAAPAAVSVSNLGAPLAAEIRERAFQRFYRAPEAVADPQRPGTGLGLAVVQQIAARHGGRASLQNFEDGRGAGVTARVEFDSSRRPF